jgi:hypothetical protein
MIRRRFHATFHATVLAALAVACFAWPAAAADDDAALLKALPNAKHSLVQIIADVSKGGEVPIEAKYEMDKGKLLVGAYTAVKGIGIDAERNSFKEYNGVSTETNWKPKTEVFKDAEHLKRSAQYATLLSLTKVTLLSIATKAAADRPGTVFEIKPVIENGASLFAVRVAHDGTTTRLTYDLVTGARKS